MVEFVAVILCARLEGLAVQVRFFRSVLLGAWLCGCATPQERPAPATTAAPLPTASLAPASALSPQAAAAEPAGSASSPPSPSAAAEREPSPTGSAYLGCGVAIPVERLWDETTESEVLDAISLAKQCARERGRRLLLEFVAPWCADCREMARLDATPLVSRVLAERFERVRVNVGKWDRHEALRANYGVRALATYVVIDPKTSRVLAQTTLEPITRKHGKKLSAEDWASWLSKH